MAHGVDARRRVCGDDAAVAVRDDDGRLIARGQEVDAPLNGRNHWT